MDTNQNKKYRKIMGENYCICQVCIEYPNNVDFWLPYEQCSICKKQIRSDKIIYHSTNSIDEIKICMNCFLKLTKLNKI